MAKCKPTRRYPKTLPKSTPSPDIAGNGKCADFFPEPSERQSFPISSSQKVGGVTTIGPVLTGVCKPVPTPLQWEPLKRKRSIWRSSRQTACLDMELTQGRAIMTMLKTFLGYPEPDGGVPFALMVSIGRQSHLDCWYHQLAVPTACKIWSQSKSRPSTEDELTGPHAVTRFADSPIPNKRCGGCATSLTSLVSSPSKNGKSMNCCAQLPCKSLHS